MGKANWRMIIVDRPFIHNGPISNPEQRTISAMAYYRTEALAQLDSGQASNGKEVYMADFVYSTHDNRVIKNRLGSVAELYESALGFDKLKYHPDERVRLALDKVLTLAALID